MEQLPEIYVGDDGRQAQPTALSVEGPALSHTLCPQECWHQGLGGPCLVTG